MHFRFGYWIEINLLFSFGSLLSFLGPFENSWGVFINFKLRFFGDTIYFQFPLMFPNLRIQFTHHPHKNELNLSHFLQKLAKDYQLKQVHLQYFLHQLIWTIKTLSAVLMMSFFENLTSQKTQKYFAKNMNKFRPHVVCAFKMGSSRGILLLSQIKMVNYFSTK